MRSRSGLLVFGVALVGAVAASAFEVPVAVSPGNASEVGLTESRCPTFSWTGVAAARHYELVIYEVAEGESTEVLRHRLPAGATSWTPSVGRCLERGGQYAWSVMAVGKQGPSAWSSPSLFEVASGPSEAEFEAALEVVRRYLADQDTPTDSAPAEPEPAPGSRRILESTLQEGAPEMTLRISGSSALRSELEAVNERTFGVVGLTHSPSLLAAGVYGQATAMTGPTYGVLGITDSTDSSASGVLGMGGTGNFGVMGLGDTAGVRGLGGIGVLGVAETARENSFAGYFAASSGNAIGAGISEESFTPTFTVSAEGAVTATSYNIDAFATNSTSNTFATGDAGNSPECPAGELLIGGGCDCGTNKTIVESFPDGTSWRCECSGSGIKAFNLCLKSPP